MCVYVCVCVCVCQGVFGELHLLIDTHTRTDTLCRLAHGLCQWHKQKGRERERGECVSVCVCVPVQAHHALRLHDIARHIADSVLKDCVDELIAEVGTHTHTHTHTHTSQL